MDNPFDDTNIDNPTNFQDIPEAGKLLLDDTPTSGSGSDYQTVSPPTTHGEKLGWFIYEFRPHFETWIFETIKRLNDKQEPLVNYIFMSCVIDYLSSFYLGESTDGKVKRAYLTFINKYFPPGLYVAEDIYQSLRVGLVHLFTIKGRKYLLIHEHPELHLKIYPISGQVILNAEDFAKDLINAANKYFDDVENTPALLDKVLERFGRDGFLSLLRVELPI